MTKKQSKSYGYEYLMVHFGGAGKHKRIFQAIENEGFLVKQARYTSGFQSGSRVVEEQVLTAAILKADWQRLLRYTLVALNLRDIASTLAEEPILRALARLDHRRLARNLVGQVTDPLVRARGRAAIIAIGEAESDVSDDMTSVIEDLDEVTVTSETDAEAWLETMHSLARLLDPEHFRHRWVSWIARLAPADGSTERIARSRERVRKAWRAVVESWITRDASVDSGLWWALAAMDDTAELPSFLPHRLAATTEESYLEQPLPPPFDDDDHLLLHIRLAILARKHDEPEAVERTMTLLTGNAVQWTPSLVEAGRDLWPRLNVQHLQALIDGIDVPEVRAALFIASLEGSANERTDLDREVLQDQALQALEAVEDGTVQLPWVLRFLRVESPSPQRTWRIRQVARYLERWRYAAEVEDLVRFLDLVAAELPSDLDRQLENIAWAPARTTEHLRAIVETVHGARLLTAIFERAEELAGAVGITPAEGFGLRRELIISTASRLFAQFDVNGILRVAASRLLPEEEDQLWLKTVETLMEEYERRSRKEREGMTSQSPEVTHRLIKRIRSPRLKLQARLLATGNVDELENWLAVDDLYASVATTATAEDELHALRPLCQPAYDPDTLAREHLDAIHDPDRRLQALIDLAYHALSFQHECFPDRVDPEAALQPLTEAIGSPSTAELLLALTPVLATVGARSGALRGVAELQEATLRILRLETADLETRLDAISALIARSARALLDEDSSPRAHPPRARCRAAASYFQWLVKLPKRLDLTKVSTDTEAGWSRILPVLLAAADHLPAVARAYLLHPVRTRILLDWFPTFTCWIGLERAWHLVDRLQRVLPFRKRFRTAWTRGAPAFDGWTDDDQLPILELCFSGEADELSARAEAEIAASQPDPWKIELLVHALATTAPDRVPKLLARLPPRGDRDALYLRLVRHRWLPTQQVEELFEHFEKGNPTLVAMRLWRDLAAEEATWMDRLAELLGRGELDDLDPDYGFLRRKLRHDATDSALRPLAEAIREAFAQHGNRGGELALRTWLDAYVGSINAASDRFAQAWVAVRQARNLPSLRTKDAN